MNTSAPVPNPSVPGLASAPGPTSAQGAAPIPSPTPAPGPAPKRSRLVLLVAVLLAVVVAVIAVGKAGSNGLGGLATDRFPDEPGLGVELDSAYPAAESGEALIFEDQLMSQSWQPGVLPDRDVIVNGSMSIVVADPDAAAAQVQAMVAAREGRIDSWSEHSWADEPRTVNLTIRVPTNALDELVASLRELGETVSLNLSSEDVTLERTDLQARITALETSIETLRAIQARAENVTDLITAETEIGYRQMDLDSMTAQLAFLTDQVDLSTLSLELHPVSLTPESGGFFDALKRGWDSLVTTATAGLYGFAELIPWLVVLGLLSIVVLFPIRLAWRRRTKGR
jgi:hypothetical protein